MFNCLNDYVILHKTLGSFANGANGATAPLLAKKIEWKLFQYFGKNRHQ